MTTFNDVQKDILRLPPDELARLREWFDQRSTDLSADSERAASGANVDPTNGEHVDDSGGDDEWLAGKCEPEVSLEELIQQQGVKPIHDLDALGRLWPEGDDPDAFLAFIQKERAERRAVAASKPDPWEVLE